MRQPSIQSEVRDLAGARRRFLAKLTPGTDGHWVWGGAVASGGWHGWFRVGAEFNAVPTHRAAWLLFRGDLPPAGMVIAGCRERALCVRPEHLEARAAEVHRRLSLLAACAMQPAAGEGWPSAKLSAAQVRAIVDLHDRFGWTEAKLGAQFGVHQSNISHILTGRSWSSVTGRRLGAA